MGVNYEKHIGQRLAKINSSFYVNGIKAQCVWYVQGRFWEKTGICLGKLPNAKDCFGILRTNKYIERTDYPRDDTIACFDGGQYGHVIFIEQALGNTLYYSEANANADNRISYDDGIIKKTTVSEFMKRPFLQGFAGKKLLKYKVTTANKNIGLYLSIGGKREKLIKANKLEVIAGSGQKVNGREWVKVVHKKRLYYAIRTNKAKVKQLKVI